MFLFYQKSDGDRNPHSQRAHTDGAVFVVHKQPIALDRFTIHDVKTPDNTGEFLPLQITIVCIALSLYASSAHFEHTNATL